MHFPLPQIELSQSCAAWRGVFRNSSIDAMGMQLNDGKDRKLDADGTPKNENHRTGSNGAVNMSKVLKSWSDVNIS